MQVFLVRNLNFIFYAWINEEGKKKFRSHKIKNSWVDEK